MRALSPLLVLAFCLCFALPGAASGSATRLMDEAIKARSAGDLAGAMEALQQAISAAQRPDQKILAQLLLGDCFMSDEKPEEARNIYEQILTQNPTAENEAEARFRLAQAWSELGNSEQMKASCRQLQKKCPNSEYAELAQNLLKLPVRKTRTTHPVRNPPAEPMPAAEPEAPRTPRPAKIVPPKTPELSDSPVAKPSPTKMPSPEIREDSATEPVKEPSEDFVQKNGKFQEVDDISQALAVQNQEPAVERRPSVARKSESGNSGPLPGGINAILSLGNPSQEEREGLATEILKTQERQKLNGTPLDAESLFQLASNTAQFGEVREACRLYDDLLKKHPSSRFVEQAYFEAIRLRVILKAYPAAKSWGEAFLKSFPKSPLAPSMKLLVNYAGEQKSSPPSNKRTEKPSASGNSGNRPIPSAALAADPIYRQGRRLLQDEHYALALEQFRSLSRQYPAEPAVWNELALLQIQLRLFPQGEKSLKKLLEIDPENDEARSLLGYIHFQRHEYHLAASDYEQTAPARKEGLNFFDTKSAARRMQSSQGRATRASIVKETGNEH